MSAWPRRVEMLLVALLLAGAAALAALQARSGLAASLAAGEPIPLLLALGDGASAPSFYLVYHPDVRALDVLAPPAGARRPPSLPAPRLRFSAPAGENDPSPAAVRRWIAGWPRGARFALAAARAAGEARDAGLYDAALLALEAYRLSPADVRLVWPAPPAAQDALYARLFAPEGAPSASLRVQVLNASGEPGLASTATELLRAQRVDVIDFGNAPPSARTRLIDRAGRPQDARALGRALGCPDLELWTQLDPEAVAPVGLVLGQDYRRCRGLGSRP